MVAAAQLCTSSEMVYPENRKFALMAPRATQYTVEIQLNWPCWAHQRRDLELQLCRGAWLGSGLAANIVESIYWSLMAFVVGSPNRHRLKSSVFACGAFWLDCFRGGIGRILDARCTVEVRLVSKWKHSRTCADLTAKRVSSAP
jgi:hypothetical protein